MAARQKLSLTHYLNVDLDLYSKSNLQPFADWIDKKAIVLFIGRERGAYSAHVEVSGLTRSADSAIKLFCALIQKLPEKERKLWDDAKVRDFNVGIQAGEGPNASEFAIEAQTVKTVCELNARIVFTIYGTKIVPFKPPLKRGRARKQSSH